MLNKSSHVFFLPWTHKWCSWYCGQMHAHERLVHCLEQDHISSPAPSFCPNIFLHHSSVFLFCFETSFGVWRSWSRKIYLYCRFQSACRLVPSFPVKLSRIPAKGTKEQDALCYVQHKQTFPQGPWKGAGGTIDMSFAARAVGLCSNHPCGNDNTGQAS